MYYIYFLGGWILGVLLGSFSLTQLLICMKFAIPFTKKLMAIGVLDNGKKILRSYQSSVLIHFVIFFGSATLIYKFGPFLFPGFIFGVLISIFFGFGHYGYTKASFSDYIESYGRYINYKRLAELDYLAEGDADHSSLRTIKRTLEAFRKANPDVNLESRQKEDTLKNPTGK